MLSIDDQEFLLRLLQPADPATVAPRFEVQLLWREQQHGSRNGRLRDGRLVEIPDRAHLGAGELPLEGFVAPLDAGDELRDVVIRRHFLGSDPFALFVVIAADEPHLGQEFFRRIGGEVEDGVFLANLRGDHCRILVDWFFVRALLPRGISYRTRTLQASYVQGTIVAERGWRPSCLRAPAASPARFSQTSGFPREGRRPKRPGMFRLSAARTLRAWRRGP